MDTISVNSRRHFDVLIFYDRLIVVNFSQKTCTHTHTLIHSFISAFYYCAMGRVISGFCLFRTRLSARQTPFPFAFR